MSTENDAAIFFKVTDFISNVMTQRHTTVSQECCDFHNVAFI